ncbi:MAG: hypothetical protein WC348_00820 [Patescibacteria group bacterium]|jgi:hypothetical protein
MREVLEILGGGLLILVLAVMAAAPLFLPTFLKYIQEEKNEQ